MIHRFTVRQAGQKCMLALFTLVIVLGAAEIAVRLINPKPHVLHHVNVAGYRLSSNPIRKYEYTPGRFDIGKGGFDDHNNFIINRHGFRDHEFPAGKSPGAIRILAMGDSVTAGNGVEDYRKTYPKLLEGMLQGQIANRTLEVFNMGIGGYHTLQEIETLREAGLPFKPDLVIIGFVINDFDEAVDGGVYNNLMRQVGKTEQRVLNDGLHRSSWQAWNYMLSRSRLLFFVYYRALTVWAKLSGPEFNYKRDVLKGLDPVESGLELLSRIMREQRFKVVIFIIPAFDWQDRQYRHTAIHDHLKQVAARYPEFKVVDLLPICIAREKDGERFTYDGLHPNEQGHQLLAEVMLVPTMEMLKDTKPSASQAIK